MVATEITTNIIIHTNNFAMNFGDEMCAYMTGEVSNEFFVDDLPGVKEAEEFKNDPTIPIKMKEDFSYNLEEVDGEHGSKYYDEITTPGWFNHGMGQIYEDTPENEVIALADYKKAATEYAQTHYVGEQLNKELSKIKSKKKVTKYGSEQGIWITVKRQLDNEHIEFLQKRAYEFAEKNNMKILSVEIDEVKMETKKTIRKVV